MKLVKTLQGERFSTPPLWIMRQAGRYLPEYRAVRKNADNFISFCLDSEKSTEVTLQPLRRFNLDAAIIFSDILMIPWAMKRDVQFIPGTGPVLKPLEADETLYLPDQKELKNLYKPISAALKNVRAHLDEDKALIGFSGAPWTLLTYMIEGGSSRDFAQTREFIFKYPKHTSQIIEDLTEQVIEFLSIQAESGVNVLKIFDSWSGAVPEIYRSEIILKPHQKIISELRRRGYTQPIICFPKGLGEGLIAYSHEVDMDGIAIDFMTDMSWANKNLRKDITLQGNLDPMALVAGGDEMRKAVAYIKEAVSERPHIFNLGHGIVPQTPIEHVEELVDLVKSA